MINARSIGFAVALSGALPSSASAQNPCSYSCGGLPTTILHACARVIGNPVEVAYTNTPQWIDASWTAYHFFPALDAWEVGTFPLQLEVGFDNVTIVFVDENYQWGSALANTYPCGSPWGWEGVRYIVINVQDYGPLYWYTGPDPGHDVDLRTVLIHELGHALGLGDIPDGVEPCSVMTQTYSGVERSTGALDQNAINCYYAPLPVSDIQSFSAGHSGHTVNLTYEISAHPEDWATVWVSDNSLGPARSISLLDDQGDVGVVNHLTPDTFRLPPGGTYYYWLNHSDFHGFEVLASPDGLFPASSTVTLSGPARPSVDPPEIYQASDQPFDLGGVVELFFYPSSDESNIDYYNIYRNSYPPGQPGQGEWRYIRSVDAPTTGYYVDQPVVTNWVNEYSISAAHHGNYALQPGTGNEGIWNSFGEPVTASAVNNFAHVQVTLTSNDTLRVCPEGDDAHLTADIMVWGSDIAPTVALPPHMIECNASNNGTHFCDGMPLLAYEPTNEDGVARMEVSDIGGSGKTDLVFGLWNSGLQFQTVTMYMKSPDINGSGTVNILDFAVFGAHYTSPPKEYLWAVDFSAPYGTITLQDFAYFTAHNNHACSGTSVVTGAPTGSTTARIQMGLTEVVSAASRNLDASITVTNVEAFKAMLFNLRCDNPMLEFDHWETGSFPGRVLVTPVVRDGVKEMAIGVLDGDAFRGDRVDLGRMVFTIKTNDDLALTPRDFEPRAADVLSASNAVLRMGASAGSNAPVVTRVVGDELAQNRPNPFNPTTTISYSISRPGHVVLGIFAVDGSHVRTLVDRDQQPNRYDVQWDGTDERGQRVASGVYFYSLRTPRFNRTLKMVLLK